MICLKIKLLFSIKYLKYMKYIVSFIVKENKDKLNNKYLELDDKIINYFQLNKEEKYKLFKLHRY